MEVYAFGTGASEDEEDEALFIKFDIASGYGEQMYLMGLEQDDRDEGFGQAGFFWCGQCVEHADRFMLCDMGIEPNPDGRPIHSPYYIRRVPVFESVEAALPEPRRT